ncbi:MAG: hypothetical protein IKL92_04385 [Oscillospiraceae bacterium]|nr:hypothetical protein [Oscillospiraceae bacterium]
MEQNNNDNRQAIIRTSFFGGFDKKEVLTYIDRLREENAAAQADLDRRLEEVTAARNDLGEQVAGFERKLVEMGGELDERSGRIKELNDEIYRLQSELKTSQKNADDTSRALVLQKEQNRILMERGRETEARAKRYDDVSAQLGDIILTARCNANELIDAAQGEADRIKTDAEKASERVMNELLSLRGELTRMREQMADMVEGFSNRITAIEDILDEIASVQEAGAEEPVQEEKSEENHAFENVKQHKTQQEREIARVVESIERRRQATTQNFFGKIFKDR